MLTPPSTLQITLQGRTAIAGLTRDMATASTELSSGLRANPYADLGMDAARSLDLRNQIARTDTYTTQNQVLTGRLETQLGALDALGDLGREVLALALNDGASGGQAGAALADTARATLDTLRATLDASHGGRHLFSGAAEDTGPLQAVDAASPATGLSPQEIVGDIVGAGPADAADAASKIAALDAVFASATGTDQDFEASFYNGADAGAPRQGAFIAEGEWITFGVQANDKPVRDLVQGLMMVSTADPDTIADPDARAAWMDKATALMASGVEGIDAARTDTGRTIGRVEAAIQTAQDRADLYRDAVVDIEGVDPAEAATRVKLLEGQLQASYATTTRMANLSILNFMR